MQRAIGVLIVGVLAGALTAGTATSSVETGSVDPGEPAGLFTGSWLSHFGAVGAITGTADGASLLWKGSLSGDGTIDVAEEKVAGTFSSRGRAVVTTGGPGFEARIEPLLSTTGTISGTTIEVVHEGTTTVSGTSTVTAQGFERSFPISSTTQDPPVDVRFDFAACDEIYGNYEQPAGQLDGQPGLAISLSEGFAGSYFAYQVERQRADVERRWSEFWEQHDLLQERWQEGLSWPEFVADLDAAEGLLNDLREVSRCERPKLGPREVPVWRTQLTWYVESLIRGAIDVYGASPQALRMLTAAALRTGAIGAGATGDTASPLEEQLRGAAQELVNTTCAAPPCEARDETLGQLIVLGVLMDWSFDVLGETHAATDLPSVLEGSSGEGLDLGHVALKTPKLKASERPVFVWTRVPKAAMYSLVVYTPDDLPYWAWEGTKTSVPLGGLPRLAPNSPGPRIVKGMSWGVVAYDKSFRPIAQSTTRSIAP